MSVALVASIVLAVFPRPHTHSAAEERSSIQRYLLGAEQLLASAAVSRLSSERLEARAHNAAVLAAYRERGEFPKNRHFPGKQLPIFHDEEGTLCAVGFLMWQSGATELVNRIAATRNYATIHELADEPGVAEWLDRAGITLEEAARIQPGYDFVQAEFTTHSHEVTRRTCSPLVSLEVYNWGGTIGREALLKGTPEASFFSDSGCTVALPHRFEFQELSFENTNKASFFFSSGTAGELRISAQLNGQTFEQTHTIRPVSSEPTETEPVINGCSAAPGMASFVLLALGLLLRRH